jgi:HSP20 family protein
LPERFFNPRGWINPSRATPMKTGRTSSRGNDPRKQRMALPRLKQKHPAPSRDAGPESKTTENISTRSQSTSKLVMNTLTKTNNNNNEVRSAEKSARPQDQYLNPEVNIFETNEGYTLEAEMPGVGKDGIEITLETNELTLIGRRMQDIPKAEALWRESSQADYRRVFQLDPAIDTNKIEARIEQGLLTLRLPKSERVKPRKVTVSD